jgi:uncharacterized integral membrane protein
VLFAGGALLPESNAGRVPCSTTEIAAALRGAPPHWPTVAAKGGLMRFRSIPLFLVLAITAVFVVMNWSVIVSPTTLSIGARVFEAPLGLILLGLMALLGLSFIVYSLSMHGSALNEGRRQSRELQASRELADKAEASRFTELRNFMSAELLRVTQAEDAMRTQIMARLDALEQQSRNALTQQIGELEGRLERYSPTVGERGH